MNMFVLKLFTNHYLQMKVFFSTKESRISNTVLDTTKFTNTKLNAGNVLEIPIIHSAIDKLIDYYITYIQPNLN